MWPHLTPEDLRMIETWTAGNHGLAPRRWTEQLEEIRALPEPDQPKET